MDSLKRGEKTMLAWIVVIFSLSPVAGFHCGGPSHLIITQKSIVSSTTGARLHGSFCLSADRMEARATHRKSRHVMCMSETSGDESSYAGNTTNIFGNVGAAGNLRFRGSGFKAPPLKADEPNFSVKPATENPALKKALEGNSKAVSFNEAAKQASFANLVDFPCTFQVKVVGARQGEFMGDILDAIGNVVNVQGSQLVHSFRDNGKWRSITVQVPVQSSDQLYEVYDAIGRDPRVKFKF